MKVRTFFSALAVVVALLLVVGAGGFWGLTARSPLGLIQRGGQSFPTASLFIPKQSPVMASLLAAPHRLVDLWQLLAAPNVRGQTQAEVERLERSLLAGSGLSYEDDIRPWLGEEITFAVTTPDLDEDGGNGQQPGYLLALSCRDPQLAQETLELYWQQRAIAGTNLVFEPFLGTQLISARAPSASASETDAAAFIAQASAVVGNRFVLLANSAEVIKQALTTAQTRTLNLQSEPAFQAALEKLPQQRVGVVVINTPQTLRWLGLATGPQPLTIGLGNDDNLFDRAVLSVRLHRQGLVADTALLVAPGHSFKPRASQPLSLEDARQLPADMSLVATGGNLADLRQTTSNLLSQYGLSVEPTGRLWETVATANRLNLSLDWLQTHYALGLTKASENQLDATLAIQQTPQTTAALQTLDQVAQQQGLSIGRLQLDSHSLIVWSQLTVPPVLTRRQNQPLQVDAEIIGVRTQADSANPYELFTTSATAMDKALHLEKTVVDTTLWAEATAPLRPNGTAYLYLDWPQLVPSLRQQFPWLRLVETAGQPLLHHVRAVAAASYDRTPVIQSGAISLYLSNLESS